MKTSWLTLFKKNRFEFGDQHVNQYVIFECKYLFSIIIFYFEKSNGSQDRYHTHAFNALSFKLFGEYTEYELIDEHSEAFTIKRRTQIFKYFPRNSYHKIGNSNGCITVLLSGPWNKTWKEFKDGVVTKYNWNRNENRGN